MILVPLHDTTWCDWQEISQVISKSLPYILHLNSLSFTKRIWHLSVSEGSYSPSQTFQRNSFSEQSSLAKLFSHRLLTTRPILGFFLFLPINKCYACNKNESQEPFKCLLKMNQALLNTRRGEIWCLICCKHNYFHSNKRKREELMFAKHHHPQSCK